MLINNRNIDKCKVELFGEKLIETDLKFAINDSIELNIPFNFYFNSSWRINHVCSECKKDTAIVENFDLKNKNYRIFQNINSKKMEESFIKSLNDLFKSIHLIEIKNTLYLNYNDFDYTSDLQRESSIQLKYYQCQNCKSEFLGLFGVGYPMESEKGLPSGRLGNVIVREIINLKPECDFLASFESAKKIL